MNIVYKNLFWSFLVTLLLNLTIPIIWPAWRLFFFAPFLIILYYQKSLPICLWGSILCGLILDLLSSRSHFGLYALNYTLTTFVLYPQRRHFFGDRLSTLPLMTFLFSLISTSFQSLLMSIFGTPVLLSWHWVLTDLWLMPLGDAAYAFICFILPWRLFGTPIRKGSEYFI